VSPPSQPTPASGPRWLLEALATPTHSHFIGPAGQRLHYRSWAAPRKDAPGLLLVHGFGAHSHWWDACAPFLARDFRVVAVDLAGMGDSDYRDAYSQRQYADDLAQVIRHADLSPALVVAHSFGGLMACWLAHHHPSLLRSLVIVDSRLGFPGDRDDRQPPVGKAPAPPYPDYPSARSWFRLIPEQHCAEPALFEHVAHHSLRRANGGWQWKFDRSIFHRLPWPEQPETELLKGMELPIHLISGELSVVSPPDFTARVAACLSCPDAFTLIPQAHHHVLLDQPLALVAVLRTVLTPLSSSFPP